MFHFNVAVISAAKGGSAVRAAAYRHGAQMTSRALGETWSYEGKAKEVIYSKVAVPDDLPEWAEREFGNAAFEKVLREVRAEAQGKNVEMSDEQISRAAWARVSQRLWDSVEDGENRLNKHAHKARYARSLTIALPAELARDQQIELMDGYVAASFTGRGMVADWVIHDKLDGNPHVHVMLTTREIGVGDWGKKQRAWNDKSLLLGWRADWARHANLALERAGFDVRIDHRTNAAQGIYLEPEGYNPHVAEHVKSRGDVAREDVRCQSVGERNAAFLRDNPEHILVVVQSKRAVFTAGDIREALQERMVFGADHELDALLREVMGSEHLVEIFKKDAHGFLGHEMPCQPNDHGQYITTARAADIQRLGTLSRDMVAGRLTPVAPVALVAELISPTLNPDQRAAAEVMLSPARLTLIKGHAGTGKTYTLNEVARVWQARGYEVLGGAPSGKATQELSGIQGMRTASLAAWEARWARGEVLPQDRFVFIMDEAGMVGAGQWARIAERVALSGGKLIAVGDPEQLQPISDVPGWDVVERAVASEGGRGSMAVMGAVQRQRDPLDRAATEALARGGAEIATAIRYYVDKGALRLGRDVLEDPVGALAEAYYQTGADKDRLGVSPSRIALAYTNRDVWDLNAAIRTQALERGEIDRPAVRSYGMITRIDRSEEIHKRISVPLELGPGDRVMLTRPHRELDLPRSSFGTVVATRDGEIDLLVDGGSVPASGSKPVTIDLKTFRDLDYGYAATIHKSQGLTVDHALVLGHWRLNRHAVYVALTRHRESVTVFGHPKYLTCPADLIRMAQTPGHLSVDLEDGPDRLVGSMVAGAEVLGLDTRGDWLGSGVSGDRGQVSFLGDGTLMAVAERVAGLLASEYVQGDPILKADPNGPGGDTGLNAGSDPKGFLDFSSMKCSASPAGHVMPCQPKGYAQEPTRVIDDLIRRWSVFKADDVASALSNVVAEPETFLRLFREAMAHPDLVVMSEDGSGGEGRIYSLGAQLRAELDAVDRGTRLALAEPAAMAPVVAMQAEDEVGLNAQQMAALEHGAQAGRLRLIRGDAGSGKTRVAARLAEVHTRAGWQVIGLTPTGAGLDALWDAGFRGPNAGGAGQTLRQFTQARREGRLQLGPNTVVLLDDAGRFGGREAGQLLEDIEASGAKLIALIDGGVQVPLEAGPVMRAIEVRVGSARLEDMQGRRPEMADALRYIAAGDARGIDLLMDQGVIHAGGTAATAAASVAARYVADQNADKIALAWSRSEVTMLTDAIRARLDATDAARAGFKPETEGAFAGLKPGDRIRFIGSIRSESIEAGEIAQVLRREDDGALRLRFEGRSGHREIAFARDARLPDWRFAFAGTIHGEMGRAHGSVHLLASQGMNRQIMAAGLNLHLADLTVTVSVDEERLSKVLAGILRRDARAHSALDYGFDTSLGAREALRGKSLRDIAPTLYAAGSSPTRSLAVGSSTGSSAADAGGRDVAAAFEPVSGTDPVNRDYLLDQPDHILAILQSNRAVFTESDIRAAFRERMPRSFLNSDIDTLANRAMATGHLVALAQDAPDGQTQYVMKVRALALKRLEARCQEMVAGRMPEPDGGVVPPAFGSLNAFNDLNGGQRAAAEAMLSPAQLTQVLAHAGTGKIYTLNEVARIWQERGYAVLGGAPSAKATQELDSIQGMRTGSLAAWEARWSRGDIPQQQKFIFVMDEAGMVGAGQWARIATRVAAMGGKLIAVGDPEQLQPISDLPGWDVAEQAVMQGGGTMTVMGAVQRQRDPLDRAATEALARGGAEIADGIQHYIDKGALRLDHAVLDDPVGALAEAYYQTGADKDRIGVSRAFHALPTQRVVPSRIALAYTNRDVWALNGAIRAQALERGEIDRSGVRNYGMITRIDRSGGTALRIEVPLELGPGDRVMLTRPHRELNLPRSSFGTVVEARDGEIDLLVDGGSVPASGSKPVTLDLNTFRDLDYGYAASVHKSLTVDHTLVLGHKRMNRHAVYVALTQHRESVTVFGGRNRITAPADLIRMAQTPGHLSVDMEDVADGSGASMVAGAEVLGLGTRGDWLGSGISGDGHVADDPAADARLTARVAFLGDASLMAVAERVSGLLASDYIQGDPILKENPNTGTDPNAGTDPKGYAQTPTWVIDDLIARRSVFKADDVAGALSNVVAEPETFLRLYAQAMAHPDLVVLSEDGHGGEGRIYSTGAQLRLELDAVDMGTRLALEKSPAMAPAVTLSAGDKAGLNAAQMAALEHGAQAGRLRLIQGDAGSGKTRVAARLAEVHARDGWQVIGLTPSGAGLDALRDAGSEARTFNQFTRARREGRLQLDPGTVVILDDAGRLGGREAGQLLADIEASGAKLIALMDDGVQVPLEAGPVMRAIEDRVGSARLEGMQGRRPGMAQALREIAAGDAHGIKMLMDQGAIHAEGTVQGAAAALATRYLMDQRSDKIVLAWSRSEVALLTKAIRAGLDAIDDDRAGFTPETEGAFAGLKPGDHIRFVASTPWQKGKPAKDAPPRIRAGECAELLGRDEEGRLRLRLEGRLGVREVIFAPEAEIPDWRFDFAITIHGEMGLAHKSVHILASPGMNRQVMVAGMNLHLDALSVTMPCAENRLPEVMAGILRRDASAQSVLDYGFDTSLGAREALRGHVYEAALDGTARAVERLREIASLAGFARLDPRPAHKALPRGMEGEVLAEVIGAMILHEGAAPEGIERLAVERVVADISDPRAWRKLLRQVPGSLPRAADDLARSTVGADGQGRLLTPARIMARGALIGRALGEDRVATLFERGLVLYGKRVAAARLLGQPEDLVPPQRAPVPEKEWPDPATRPEKWKPYVRGQHSKANARVALPWRIDVARLLGEVPRAEQVIAEQVLEDMAGMFGLGRRRRSKGYIRHYSAWRAAAKTRAVDVARGTETLDQTPVTEQSATQVLERTQNQRRKDITTEAARKVALVKTRSGPWDKAPVDPMAVPGRDYAGMGLQLAQAVSERVDVHSPVQDMDLPLNLEALVRAADPGPKFNFTDEEIFARIPQLPRLEGESATLAAAVGKALTEGPPDDIATLRAERAVILSHLGAPEAGRFAAKEFVPRLRSFTHNELWAMSAPTAAWPGSLPPRSAEERQRIAKSFNGYAEKFEKEKTMQNTEQTKGIKNNMVKKLALGRIDAQDMEVVEKTFSLDEIMALRNPKREWPSHLPPVDPEVRAMIAKTLDRVARGEIAGAGGSGQAPAPQMKIAPEYATLGLQMACAITDRVDASSQVHKLPLQAQISQLLKQANARTDLPQDKVDQLARGIAKDRAALESKIAFAKELIAGAPPPRLQGKLPDRFDEHVFLSQVRLNGGYDQNEHPMRGNQYPLQQRFANEVEGRIARDLAAGTAEPTKEEYIVARMALLPDRSKAEVKVSDALTDALRWGRPIDSRKLHEERIKLPVELASVGDIGLLEAEDTLSRVYRSFTYPEIMALADPDRPLPKTMRAMDDALRASAAQGFAKSTNVTKNTLLIFPWKNHAMRHGLGLSPGQSLNRGSGMSMG